MKTVEEIEQMFDRKIAAMKKEIVAELKTEVLDKIAADVEELKEQTAANRLAIDRLEKEGTGKSHILDGDYKDDKGTHLLKPTVVIEHQDVDRKNPPRFHKLQFPTYDGESDPLPWLNRVERFFKGQHTEEESKVWMASYHLTDDAALWYRRLEKMCGEPPWPQFVKYINHSFGPTIRTSRLAEIKHLRQTRTIQEYKKQFLTLVCRCDSLTEEQHVELLTAGLCNPVRTDVDLQYPSNLEAAMSLAFAYERRGHEDEEDFPTQVPKSSGSKLLKSTVTIVPAVAKGTS
jgi:hypothetical protein